MAGDSPTTRGVVDTAVVGGGVAGLAVARHLVTAGRSVVVLEARDQVGGRLRSVRAATSGRVDLGATWYWPGERRVIELVAELGVRTHDQHVTGDAMYDAPEGAIRIDGNPIDVPAFRFTDGADSLTEAMTAALPAGTVRLSLPVHLVDAASSDLVVHAGSSVVECRTAVLALAPAAGIVQIGFRPPLPDSIAALARATPVWMGTTTKVVAIYDEPFWRAEGLSGSAISHLGPLREIHDMAGPDGTPAALFGFAPSGGTIEHAAVVEQLTRLFGPEAAEPTELHVMDWAQDLSLAGEEPSTAFELFGHPVHRQPLFDGRLVWASTETATDSPGHVEGALEAAEHAAREVLATLEHTPIPTGGEST